MKIILNYEYHNRTYIVHISLMKILLLYISSVQFQLSSITYVLLDNRIRYPIRFIKAFRSITFGFLRVLQTSLCKILKRHSNEERHK